jgi:hypothetical protein
LAKNLNVTCPGATPKTLPSLLTVAMALLLLVQIPPDEGDTEVVAPAQIEPGPETETTGLAFIVIY